MRKRIVAGNWKMNKTPKEGIELAKEINAKVSQLRDHSVEIILGTPYIHLMDVAKTVNPAYIKVAAQNCAAWSHGAYTGEISAEMIRLAGAEYVILGHSERRKYFHESGEILKAKVILALENMLKPIFCCGEVLEERNAEKHFFSAFALIDDFSEFFYFIFRPVLYLICFFNHKIKGFAAFSNSKGTT